MDPAGTENDVLPSIQTTVARSETEILRLREDWLRLRQNQPQTPNADLDRFLATVRSLGEDVKPHVALIRDEAAPLALVLGRTIRRPVSCRFGYRNIPTPRLECLDVVYGGLLTDGEPRSRQALVSYFSGLLARREVEHVMLNHLSLNHVAYSDLVQLGVRGPIEPHWTVKLAAGSYEESIAHHSGDYRKRLRRYDRKVMDKFEGNVRVDVFTTVADVDRFLEMAEAVSVGTYKVALGSAVLNNETWRALLRVEAEKGRLRSYVLSAYGRPLAYQNGSIYERTYMCDGRGYRAEYRDYSLGTVLFVRVMRDLCERGMTLMDFGFGDAEHKRIWGTAFTEEATIHLYGRGLRPQCARAMDVIAPVVSMSTQRCVESLGLLRTMKRRWRDKLARHSWQQRKDAQ